MVLLDVKNVKKFFPVKKAFFTKRDSVARAVDGVDFRVYKGETLGLVGESGCGKTTLGRLITRLEEPTEGKIYFNGEDILRFSGKRLKHFRRDVQLIFQDPYMSLNPRMTARAIVAEGFKVHSLMARSEREQAVTELMEIVGFSAEHMNRYPHEFSGGQRQRIGIARALALKPKLIVADEPVSALDVSIQAQILNLLKDLQSEFAFTYLFISHDLSVVGYMSDRIAVMYLGKIVELADRKTLYENPFHPYTKALLASVPEPDPDRKKEHSSLKGDVPSPLNPPSGCSFHPRCPCRMDICERVEPFLEELGRGHSAACHLIYT